MLGGVETVCRVRLILALGLALAVLSCAGPRSSATAESYPMVQWASLAQSGQDLVWRVQLSAPFTAAGLAQQNETLCLLIQQVTTGALREEVCLTPAGRRSALVNMPYGGSRRRIDATITRPTPTTLRAQFLPGAVELQYRELQWQTQAVVGPPTCVASSACTTQYPAQGQVLQLHTPKLVACVANRGPSWVFNGSPKVHDIALTFDDGPWLLTPELLTLLEREHVPATFFQIGEWVSVYGQHDRLERRMLRDGDMIGDHTWTHPDMVGLSTAAQRSQIVQAADAIRSATGFYPCLYRAPYGDSDSELLGLVRSLHMTTIQWDIDPRDWALPGVAEIEDNVIDNARNGGIVEMHDGGGPRQETLDALPTMISTLRKRGYKFVTITQMMGYRLIYK